MRSGPHGAQRGGPEDIPEPQGYATLHFGPRPSSLCSHRLSDSSNISPVLLLLRCCQPRRLLTSIMAFEGAAFATNTSTTSLMDGLSGTSFTIGAMVGFPVATLVFLYALYLYSLPKPLPNIPYDPAAAKSILGSAASLVAHQKSRQRFASWFAQEAKRLNSPLCQVWLLPFSKPQIVLNDAREAQDLLQRRGKEFTRSTSTAVGLYGTMEEFHLGFVSEDYRFKRNKEVRNRHSKRPGHF